MSYNRPIIVEIYADLYLEPGTLPFSRFFTVVPELQRHGFPTVEAGEAFRVDVDVPAGRMVSSSRPHRVRCWSADRFRLIQLAPDNIVMNLVSPDGTYPGWQAFMDDVFTPAIRSVSSTLSEWRAESVALSTLDRVAISSAVAFRLGDYLNCGGPRIPMILADTTAAFDYDIGRGLLQVDGRNRQLHISGQVTAASYVIQMQALLHDRVSTNSDLGPTLDRLHDESVEWFESLITDKMRNDVMQGEAHADSRLR